MRIAICDDSGSDRAKIESLLVEYVKRKTCDFEYMGYGSGQELLEALKGNDIPEIILLDINMDDIDGLTMAGKIREMLPDIPIVLITAFMSYALDGYRVKANRFLVKDDLEITLPDCMDDMLYELSKRKRMMTFDFEEGIRKLPLDSIVYVESYGHKAVFHTADATYRQNRKLEEIEKELGIYDFVRVHKSFVVNMKYVMKVSNYSLTLQEGCVISVPRSRYAGVKQAYARYRGAHMSGASIWLIYFSMTFLEMTAFYVFFHSFFENRINGAVTIFLSYLIVISTSLIMDWFGQWKMPVQAIIFIFICRLLYRASWKQATFFSMLYLSAAWMWDMAVVGLTWRWVPLSYEWPAMIITYVSKSVFILFILCIKKMFAPAWDMGLYRGEEWNRVIFIPVISVIYGTYCYTKIRTIDANAATVMGIISVVLLSIDVVFYKIVQDMVRERQELQVATAKGQKMQSRIDAYNEMEGLLRLQRKKLHDYKNQVQTIAGLIDDGREKEAGSLAKQLAENLSVDSSVVDTKNVTINAILNQKYCTSKERGIGMTFVVGDLSGVSLPAVEIIIIIGNLLDNAIAECEKLIERGVNPVIRVTATDEEQFAFSVKNPVSEEVMIEGNSVVKEYEPGHGIGLSNVWDVAEKYDGSFGISCDGKDFTATVII